MPHDADMDNSDYSTQQDEAMAADPAKETSQTIWTFEPASDPLHRGTPWVAMVQRTNRIEHRGDRQVFGDPLATHTGLDKVYVEEYREARIIIGVDQAVTIQALTKHAASLICAAVALGNGNATMDQVRRAAGIPPEEPEEDPEDEPMAELRDALTEAQELIDKIDAKVGGRVQSRWADDLRDGQVAIDEHGTELADAIGSLEMHVQELELQLDTVREYKNAVDELAQRMDELADSIDDYPETERDEKEDAREMLADDAADLAESAQDVVQKFDETADILEEAIPAEDGYDS